MISGNSSSELVCLKMIQPCGRNIWVGLKVPGEELYWISNCPEKLFDQMGHGGLVSGSRNLEFLPEFRHMEEYCFGFIGHRSIEEGNGLNDVVGDSFELLSWFN